MVVLSTESETRARRRPRPLGPESLGLPAEVRTAERRAGLTAHIRATVDAGLRVLLAEQATAGLADAPESVHQMRVAARRMRVALRMDDGGIGPDAGRLRAELAWLGSLLGGVRDLDVLTDRLSSEGAELPESDLPAFGEVLTMLLAQRTAAADTLVEGLRRQRYRTLLETLAAVAVGPADAQRPPKAASLLVKPVRAVHLQLAATRRAPTDDGWHELRIRVKRVRYAAELAGQLAGPRRRATITTLARQAKSLQELLGEFQDTVVTEQYLRVLVADHGDALSPAALLVVGRLVERQVARRAELREQLPAASVDLYRATTES